MASSALLAQREVSTAESPVFGREPSELLEALAPRVGPERMLDLMLRTGPYGDGFGARTDGPQLTLAEAPGRTPWDRSRSADAAFAGGAAHAERQDRARARAGRGRRRPDCARRLPSTPAARRQRQRLRARRPPPAALEQLLDAQPAGARQRQAALHAPRPSGRCRPARARGRRVRDRPVTDR